MSFTSEIIEPISFPTWDDELLMTAQVISQVANQISLFLSIFSVRQIAPRDKKVFTDNIFAVLRHWTGRTYIGERKDELLSEAYQEFFSSLYSFLIRCSGTHFYRSLGFPNDALYEGLLFRVLGYNSPSDNNILLPVKPIYDGIWVSWSKNPVSESIKCKLYGSITFIKSKAAPPLFGIDLESFACSKPGEREVVFPTLKDSISSVSYELLDSE